MGFMVYILHFMYISRLYLQLKLFSLRDCFDNVKPSLSLVLSVDPFLLS